MYCLYPSPPRAVFIAAPVEVAAEAADTEMADAFPDTAETVEMAGSVLADAEALVDLAVLADTVEVSLAVLAEDLANLDNPAEVGLWLQVAYV